MQTNYIFLQEMKMRQVSIHYLVLLCLLFSSCNRNESNDHEIVPIPESQISWAYKDSLILTIEKPVIPEKTVRLTSPAIKNSDYETDLGSSINTLIDQASENGGGTVLIPPGKYLSNPIILKSNVNLCIEEGAIIKFNSDIRLYKLVFTWFEGIPCMNYSSLIYANNQKNIKISGAGIIDGQGYDRQWKSMKYRENIDWKLLRDLADENVSPENRIFGMGHNLRPDLINLMNCDVVEITGVTILNAPYWTVHPVLCKNVRLTNIRIESEGYNQIGIVPECTQKMLIDSVIIAGLNDGIRIKSGRVKDPQLTSSENIIIQNSSFLNIVSDAVAIGSKAKGGINRVFISNITIDKANCSLSVSADAKLRGVVKEVLIKDVNYSNIMSQVIYCGIGNNSTRIKSPILYNLRFDNITGDSSARAFLIKGSRRQPIQNVKIENSTFNSYKGSIAEDVKNLKLSNFSDDNTVYNQVINIEDIKTDKIDYNKDDEDILDTDDISFDQLNDSVKEVITRLHPLIPINNINRIITKTKVNYEIEFNLENSKRLRLLISSEGEIIRSEQEILFKDIPDQVISSLKSCINTEPLPFLMSEIIKIQVQDFSYYEVKGETRSTLFLAGIAEDGSILEQKMKQINNTFPSIIINK